MKPKINILVASLFIFYFSACSNNKSEGIISKKKMTHIIVDMNLLEESLYASKTFHPEQQKRRAYYLSVFEKYNVTEEQFDKSLEWYVQKPKELEAIYEQVSVILKETEQKWAEKEESEKANQPAE